MIRKLARRTAASLLPLLRPRPLNNCFQSRQLASLVLPVRPRSQRAAPEQDALSLYHVCHLHARIKASTDRQTDRRPLRPLASSVQLLPCISGLSCDSCVPDGPDALLLALQGTLSVHDRMSLGPSTSRQWGWKLRYTPRSTTGFYCPLPTLLPSHTPQHPRIAWLPPNSRRKYRRRFWPA